MNLFLTSIFKNKHLFIYKNITYYVFLNNVFNLANKLQNLQDTELFVYLPNSYQLIEFIIASIFANKNINYLQYSTIHKLHTIQKYTSNESNLLS